MLVFVNHAQNILEKILISPQWVLKFINKCFTVHLSAHLATMILSPHPTYITCFLASVTVSNRRNPEQLHIFLWSCSTKNKDRRGIDLCFSTFQRAPCPIMSVHHVNFLTCVWFYLLIHQDNFLKFWFCKCRSKDFILSFSYFNFHCNFTTIPPNLNTVSVDPNCVFSE